MATDSNTYVELVETATWEYAGTSLESTLPSQIQNPASYAAPVGWLLSNPTIEIASFR